MYEKKSYVGDEWVVHHTNLRKKTSRFFAKPKKVKSLGRIFTGGKEADNDNDEQLQHRQQIFMPNIASDAIPNINTGGGGGGRRRRDHPQFGFSATATVLQYPPKPLRYSADVSPPSDDILPSSPQTPTSPLKARQSCNLKMPSIDDEIRDSTRLLSESSERRSSAPAVAPRRSKSRVFSFLWSK
ncbi:hypothetical protein VTP01DRAFT_4780 [Rhizomucor pusillus]|uniref:uncharacterized protein n=1 Tax=Rhizomucor pusillus TaxID=4840 RepID=UPI003742298B